MNSMIKRHFFQAISSSKFQYINVEDVKVFPLLCKTFKSSSNYSCTANGPLTYGEKLDR